MTSKNNNDIVNEIIQIRRQLHRYPELSFKEKQTSSYIYNYINKIGLHPVYVPDSFSVYCMVSNNRKKKILLRADIDALPIQEQTMLQYSSANDGVMHACGHDVHSAILAGVAHFIANNKDILKYDVCLLFQSGEEKNPGGASAFINSSFFKSMQFDYAFALHLSPEIDTGMIGIKPNYFMASNDEFYIEVKSTGGHAAQTGEIYNPIFTASKVCLDILALNKKNLNDQFVINIGNFMAEGSTNIVPPNAKMQGTMRTYDNADRTNIRQSIQQIVENRSVHNTVEVILKYEYGYPALFNSEEACNILIDSASRSIGNNNITFIERRLTSDDFSYIAEKVPSCYFRLGCGSTTKLHTPEFNPDENCMLTALTILSNLLIE